MEVMGRSGGDLRSVGVVKRWKLDAFEKPRHDGFTELPCPGSERLPSPRAALQKGSFPRTSEKTVE
jgi:hypothetical protein